MNTKNFNSLTTNNLKKIEQLIWDSFKQGVKNKKSSFHYPTIATCGNKTFNLRTVILRNVIRENRIIDFHTDHRSKKIMELKKIIEYFCMYTIIKIKSKYNLKVKQKY